MNPARIWSNFAAGRRARKAWREVLSMASVEARFQAIYERNLWGDAESRSGAGSTAAYTEQLRDQLPRLVTRFSITRIFDAPCGDLNWMKLVLPGMDVSYIGADIVKPLIEAHKARYGEAHPRVRFMHLDLIAGPYPMADLMICRDCLFHLSYADTVSVLRNFIDSGIPYLLTTTHRGRPDFSNRDIVTGDFRLMNLFAPPYGFAADPCHVIDDWVAPGRERLLCLWTRAQVAAALAGFGHRA